MEEERVLHCWMGRREATEEAYEAVHGKDSWWGSEPFCETWQDDWKDGTCMLEAGHDGPHEFTDDDCIGVTFVPAEELPS
jgi:hypothetical protein